MKHFSFFGSAQQDPFMSKITFHTVHRAVNYRAILKILEISE